MSRALRTRKLIDLLCTARKYSQSLPCCLSNDFQYDSTSELEALATNRRLILESYNVTSTVSSATSPDKTMLRMAYEKLLEAEASVARKDIFSRNDFSDI